jgi:hypothetical protein
MPELHCPGRMSTTMSLSSALVACPGCGNTVEIFGDEVKVHCRCGQYVFQETLPSCAQWCKEAERCFGQVGSFPQALRDTCAPEDLRSQEQRFRELQTRVIMAVSKCPHPETRDRTDD